VGSLKDKINTFVLKQKLIRKSIMGIFCKQKVKFGAIESGFSSKMIDRFFKPFSQEFFLENKLETQ
jgi:hypothetical protein